MFQYVVKRLFVLAAALAVLLSTSSAAQPAHAESAVQVVSGVSHSCALTPNGDVYCWGFNLLGQLGDGSTELRDRPVKVKNLEEPIKSLTAGHFHTCGLSESGNAYCWGADEFDQIGVDADECGDEIPTRCAKTAVQITALGGGIVSLNAGVFHTCAAPASGGVRCWGSNGFGQLGTGSSDRQDRSTPVTVPGIDTQVTALVGGDWHSCALTAAGSVSCWGRNRSGELGDGGACESVCGPAVVVGLESGVTDLVAGSTHTCALLEEGSVRCWGSNTFGSLGNGTTEDSSVPVEVAGLPAGVTSLSASAVGKATCALFADGPPMCWGMNSRGLLGDGTQADQPSPVPISILTDPVQDLGLSSEHTCAAIETGAVKCWGNTLLGALGNGTANEFSVLLDPVTVDGFDGGAATDDSGRFLSSGSNSGSGVNMRMLAVIALIVLALGAGAFAVLPQRRART